MVDIICTLTNRFCNVDTIDDSVMGSFQQIDLNRHLEEIAQASYSLLTHHCQHAILDGAKRSREYKDLATHMQAWEAFNQLNRPQIGK